MKKHTKKKASAHIFIDLSVLNHQRRTGLGRFSTQLMQALAHRGANSYTYLCSGDVQADFRPRGARRLSVDIYGNDTLDAQKELCFWAQQAQADIVMGTYYPVPARRSSFRSVLTIHDLIPLRLAELYRGYLPYQLMDGPIRHNAALADAIITVSQSAKRDIIELYGIPASRIHVISEGADSRFCPIKKGTDPMWPTVRRQYAIHKPYILSLCAFSIQKNLARTLQAFAIVKSQPWARDLQLVLAGMAGSSQGLLAQAMATHPYRRDIIHTDYIPEAHVAPLYRHALAFVAPSLYEGFGLPMLEAMQCGTAVVTSTLSSIPEVVGEAAFTCDAYHAPSIAYAITQCCTSDSLRQQKIQLGLAQAKKFSWDIGAAQTEAVFAQLLH